MVHAVDEVTDFELRDRALSARRCDRRARCRANALRAAERAGALVSSRRAGRARGPGIHVAAQLTCRAAFRLATGGGPRAGHALAGRLVALAVVAERARPRAHGAARAAVVDVVTGVDALSAAAFEPAAGPARRSARTSGRAARTSGRAARTSRSTGAGDGTSRPTRTASGETSAATVAGASTAAAAASASRGAALPTGAAARTRLKGSTAGNSAQQNQSVEILGHWIHRESRRMSTSTKKHSPSRPPGPGT